MRRLALIILALVPLFAAAQPTCSWNNPGADPYRGDVPSAVDRYSDIPIDTREKLKKRMQQRQYDDIALITRDKISGEHEYTDLRDMHFGAGRICGRPDRSKWTRDMRERGLVYCEDGTCLIVPTVCRNVSRVTKLKTLQAPSAAEAVSGGDQISFQPIALAGPISIEPVTFEEGVRGIPAKVSMTYGAANYPIFATIFLPAPPPIGAVIPSIPEPSTWLLLLAGGGIMLWVVKRRR